MTFLESLALSVVGQDALDDAANEHRADGFLSAPTDISGEPLVGVHAVYRRWFGKRYDFGALDCVLAAAAAERLGGDPPWLLVVGGSGHAKTETILPVASADSAWVISTISGEAALLSGTSKKDRAKDATGGLLPKIGKRGILVIKDTTSILSMNRDTRALVLAALREIYDGSWSRNVGTDGGQTLIWKGRLVVIGAVTTAWDSAHQVIATMGDRFVLVRLNSEEHRQDAGRQAMRNVNSEANMREQLATAVRKVLGAMNPAAQVKVTDAEIDTLLGLADLVTCGRTAVERDFQGEPVFAHGLEMPTRFAKQLVQIVRGGIALGMSRKDALDVAKRCAADTMPPLRLAVLGDVAKYPETPTSDVVKRLQLPRQTVDRVLRELHLLGLLTVDDRQWGTSGVRWIYSLASTVDRDALGSLSLTRNVSGSQQ